MAYQIAKGTISGRSVTIFTDDDIVNNNSDSSKHFDNYGSGVSSYNSCIWIHSSGYKVFFIYALSSTTFRVRYDDNSQDYTTTALGNLSGTLYGAARGVGSYNGCYIVWGSNALTLSDAEVPVFNDIDEATAYISSPSTPTPTYTWESVASITGKDKTYRLTDILNINDGEAVDDVSPTGNVDFSAKSKVNNLIDAVLQDDSQVTVNYTIPSGTYSYIKLVYKKDYIPTSYTDGTAIDITQSSTEKIISGIADGSTYWFVIFTDISESEPVSLDTVRTGWMGEEVILLYSGNSNTMTAQISDGHILFKLYSGETVIYSFNAYAGSTVSDANKIYVQFLKDDTNEIAKPSLVYFDGTNYSINQETPTDEQMSAIYTWLSAGLPSS